MHPSIENLVSIRDGEPVDVDVARHVSRCHVCAGELDRLSAVRRELASLPVYSPPPRTWARVQHGLVTRQTRRRPWRIGAGVALAASAAIAMVFLSWLRPTGIASVESQTSTATATAAGGYEGSDVAALVERSRELEAALRAVPPQPSVMRASTAGTVAVLEDRVATIDYLLTLGLSNGGLEAPDDYASRGAGALTPAQTERLWRERVELMNSLVHVRYAEARRISY